MEHLGSRCYLHRRYNGTDDGSRPAERKRPYPSHRCSSSSLAFTSRMSWLDQPADEHPPARLPTPRSAAAPGSRQYLWSHRSPGALPSPPGLSADARMFAGTRSSKASATSSRTSRTTSSSSAGIQPRERKPISKGLEPSWIPIAAQCWPVCPIYVPWPPSSRSSQAMSRDHQPSRRESPAQAPG